MFEGRKQPRVSKRFQVQISSPKDTFVNELSTTQNVSPYGVRVITARSWARDSSVLVKSSEGDLWARARVVYCEPLSKKSFAVGLQFLARTGEWIMGSRFWSPSEFDQDVR